MRTKLNGRPVEVDQYEFHMSEGCYVVSAFYVDGDCEELTDEEMDKLEQLEQAYLYQEAYEHACERAIAYYEGDR